MFNFLKRTQTEITITLDRPNGTYAPGEPISGSIVIRPNNDLKLRGAMVMLIGTEEYEYQTTTYTTDSEGNSRQEFHTTWGSSQLLFDERRILGEGVLSGGVAQNDTFQFDMPADALPTCAGKILRVYWQIDVKLDRAWESDLHATVEVRVVTRFPESQGQSGEYGQSNEPDEADLALILPGLTAASGQSVSGYVRVLPRKDFESRVRLELVGEEHVSVEQGNRHENRYAQQLAGSTRFTAGRLQTMPFQIPVPPDAAPTIVTPNGSISWRIKGILDRSLRTDTSVEQGIDIYPT